MNNEEIGAQLRAHREAEPKLTLDQLSEATNGVLSPSRISNYEQGSRTMPVEAAKILSEAFARLGRPISPAKLIGLECEPARRVGPLVRLDTLEECIAILEETLPSDRYRIPAKKRAQIIHKLYNLVSPDGKVPMAEIRRLVKPVKDKYGGPRDGGGGKGCS